MLQTNLVYGEMEGGVKERKAKEQRERIAKGMPGGRAVYRYHLGTRELEAGPAQGWSQPCSQPVLPETASKQIHKQKKPERVTGRGGKKKKKELQAPFGLSSKRKVVLTHAGYTSALAHVCS